jgi:hypothetical protein
MLFIEFPGAYERQLQRKHSQPSLFGITQDEITSDMILMARQQDSEEAEKFMNSFRSVVERAVSLKPNEQSDVILKLKEELDQHYQHCCSLQGDMQPIKKALRTLIQAIMNAVRSGAGNDVTAQAKLNEEDTAREEHFRLQELTFITDMMREEKSIPADELALTLITEPMNVVTEALELFQAQDIATLITELHEKFSSLDDETIKPYQDKMEAIANKLTQSADDSVSN